MGVDMQPLQVIPYMLLPVSLYIRANLTMPTWGVPREGHAAWSTVTFADSTEIIEYRRDEDYVQALKDNQAMIARARAEAIGRNTVDQSQQNKNSWNSWDWKSSDWEHRCNEDPKGSWWTTWSKGTSWWRGW